MSEDYLKRPVHKVLLKPTHIEKLAKEGRLPKELAEKFSLPKEEKESKSDVVKYSRTKLNVSGKGVHKKNKLRARLRVIHNQVPEFSEEEQPPCDTCKTAPCCRAFLVGLTQEEYESGLYDPYVVKFTSDMLNQLDSKFLLITRIGSPTHSESESVQFFLDKRISEPCPFLDENSRCSIYEKRPLICRHYTCVGDERITQEMRDGTEPV